MFYTEIDEAALMKPPFFLKEEGGQDGFLKTESFLGAKKIDELFPLNRRFLFFAVGVQVFLKPF